MNKHLRLIRKPRVHIDEWSKENFPLPRIPPQINSRHFRRRAKYFNKDGTVIVEVNFEWFIHCLRDGTKILYTLPF